MHKNPFSKIIRSKAQLDDEAKQRLADLLEPYVWVIPESSAVVFKDNAPNLTSVQRVIVFLLSHKVIALVNPEAHGRVTPREVEAGTSLPGGTVRPKLAALAKRKLVVREDGAYEIAPYFSLAEIERLLQSGAEAK